MAISLSHIFNKVFQGVICQIHWTKLEKSRRLGFSLTETGKEIQKKRPFPPGKRSRP